GVDARFQIDDAIRSADNRIEDRANRAPDDEMSAEVVQVIGANCKRWSNLLLDAEVKLLHHRILQVVINDIDAACPGTGKNDAGKGRGKEGRERRNSSCGGIKKEEITGEYLDGKRAPVKPAFESLNLKRHAVVIDALAAVNACMPALSCPVKADSRS